MTVRVGSHTAKNSVSLKYRAREPGMLVQLDAAERSKNKRLRARWGVEGKGRGGGKLNFFVRLNTSPPGGGGCVEKAPHWEAH